MLAMNSMEEKMEWLNLANYHAINLLIELTNVLHMLCAHVIFGEILG